MFATFGCLLFTVFGKERAIRTIVTLSATTLLLTIALSSFTFIGNVFAETSNPPPTPTGTCTITNQDTGQKTCTGTVDDLQPQITECVEEISPGGHIAMGCAPPTPGNVGTVSVTGTELITTTCTTRSGHHVPGQGGTETITFSGTSGTVTGGAKTITKITQIVIGGPNVVHTETTITQQPQDTFTILTSPNSHATNECNGRGLEQTQTFKNQGEEFTFNPTTQIGMTFS